MSTASLSRPAVRAGTGALIAGALVAAAAAVALGLQSVQLSTGLAAAGAVAAVAVLALAVARLDMAATLGFLLLGIVRIEPAPVDAVFAIVIAVALATGRLTLTRVPRWAAAAIMVFLATNLIGAPQSVSMSRAAMFFSITLYLCAFGLWISSWVDRPERARRLLICYLAVAVVSSIAATAAIYLSFPGSAELVRFGGRATGLFKDPNVYGPFMVPAVVWLISELLEPRLLRLRAVSKFVLLLVVVAGVFFAYSRAAWLNCAVAIAVMLVISPLRRGGAKRAAALLVAVVACSAAVTSIVALTGSIGFVQERAHYQSYDANRFGAQERGFVLAERNPLGVGPGQFEIRESYAAHSTYIRALTEEGLLGTVALGVLLFGTLYVAVRNVVAGRSAAGFGSIALLGCWCGILANSVFVDTLHWRHLWIVAGLIWAASLRAAPAARNA